MEVRVEHHLPGAGAIRLLLHLAMVSCTGSRETEQRPHMTALQKNVVHELLHIPSVETGASSDAEEIGHDVLLKDVRQR